MVVSYINDAGGVGPIRSPQPKQTEPTPPAKTPPPVTPQATDRADVTPGQTEEARLLDAARLVLESLPDVRADKVELAKKRLADGFYDRPEVRDEIAGRILADPELKPAPGLTPEREAEVRKRLDSGFYDQPEAQDKIARGLLDDTV